MLDIILKIISILGIILLVFLCVVLILIILVLFLPITYRISGQKSEEAFNVRIKINWFLGLLRARFFYPEPGYLIVKLLCFTLFRSDSSGKEEDKAPEAAAKTSHTDFESDARRETSENVSSDTKAEKTISQKEESSQEQNATPKGLKGFLIAKYEKIKYTILKIYAKIKHIFGEIAFYRELLQDERTKGLFHHAYCRLKKILKSIRPRKLHADIVFGTGSPDTTGYVMGVYGMFSPILGKHMNITPDFTQAVFLGEFYAAGHITIFQVVYNSLKVLFDKRLRLLGSKIKNHNKKS